MAVAIVTGSAGLVGSDAVRAFAARGMDVVGIDNDMRAYFFGAEASTAWNRARLEAEVPRYTHVDADIRDLAALQRVFERYGQDIRLVLHAASQPSHDWAANEPLTDFGVNATGTVNLLELTRKHSPDAVFLFVSTNKVYGDTPNRLPLVERETRWELAEDHPYFLHGIDETMSIDRTLHSVFGASKVAADVMVQEYGRYFGLRTGCFRGGCLTGPNHSGARLHGFLAYLARCAVTGAPYTVYGYKGKQVRDNIHSADLVEAFWQFFLDPRPGEVYNIGGGRRSNCSMIEAITICEALTGRPLNHTLVDENRVGDHQWWISDTSRFRSHYPAWEQRYTLQAILEEIVAAQQERACAS